MHTIVSKQKQTLAGTIRNRGTMVQQLLLIAIVSINVYNQKMHPNMCYQIHSTGADLGFLEGGF